MPLQVTRSNQTLRPWRQSFLCFFLCIFVVFFLWNQEICLNILSCIGRFRWITWWSAGFWNLHDVDLAPPSAPTHIETIPNIFGLKIMQVNFFLDFFVLHKFYFFFASSIRINIFDGNWATWKCRWVWNLMQNFRWFFFISTHHIQAAHFGPIKWGTRLWDKINNTNSGFCVASINKIAGEILLQEGEQPFENRENRPVAQPNQMAFLVLVTAWRWLFFYLQSIWHRISGKNKNLNWTKVLRYWSKWILSLLLLA